MAFELQPSLENHWIKLEPLESGDFEALYAVASDPLIWEQDWDTPQRASPARCST